jgi:hypothetical protein
LEIQMPVLHIEHPVPDYAAWKRAFDSDPVGRVKGGVRRHRVLRPVGDPHYVVIDLDFDTLEEAETFQATLQRLWNQVTGQLITGPQSRILETLEAKDY